MFSLLRNSVLLVFAWLLIAGLALKCQVVNAAPFQAEKPVSPEDSARSLATKALGKSVRELDKAVLQIHHAKDGSYWFGSATQGAFHYQNNSIIRYTTQDGLAGNRIGGIQEDQAGGIYFNTNKGITKFDGQSFTILTLSNPLAVLPSPWKLEPDDLWFGGSQDTGEVLRYDGKTLTRHLLPSTKIGQELVAKFPRDKFPNAIWNPNDVYRIYKDSKGSIWFGTAGAGLCLFDGKELKWIYESHLTDVPEGGTFGIRSILEDRQGDFWICNTRYRFRFDADSGDQNAASDKLSYKRMPGVNPFKAPDGNDHIYFMDIAEDKEGKLWMATYRFGIWCYDGTQMKKYPVLDGTQIVSVFSMYQDRAGQLWLGTQEAGVYKFDGQQFVRFQPTL